MSTVTQHDRRNAEYNRRDMDMYGAVDMEALAADTTLNLSKDHASMALLLVGMLDEAKEMLALDTESARQLINRSQFLIHRCCPMLNPSVDEVGVSDQLN